MLTREQIAEYIKLSNELHEHYEKQVPFNSKEKIVKNILLFLVITKSQLTALLEATLEDKEATVINLESINKRISLLKKIKNSTEELKSDLDPEKKQTFTTNLFTIRNHLENRILTDDSNLDMVAKLLISYDAAIKGVQDLDAAKEELNTFSTETIFDQTNLNSLNTFREMFEREKNKVSDILLKEQFTADEFNASLQIINDFSQIFEEFKFVYPELTVLTSYRLQFMDLKDTYDVHEYAASKFTELETNFREFETAIASRNIENIQRISDLVRYAFHELEITLKKNNEKFIELKNLYAQILTDYNLIDSSLSANTKEKLLTIIGENNINVGEISSDIHQNFGKIEANLKDIHSKIQSLTKLKASKETFAQIQEQSPHHVNVGQVAAKLVSSFEKIETKIMSEDKYNSNNSIIQIDRAIDLLKNKIKNDQQEMGTLKTKLDEQAQLSVFDAPHDLIQAQTYLTFLIENVNYTNNDIAGEITNHFYQLYYLITTQLKLDKNEYIPAFIAISNAYGSLNLTIENAQSYCKTRQVLEQLTNECISFYISFGESEAFGKQVNKLITSLVKIKEALETNPSINLDLSDYENSLKDLKKKAADDLEILETLKGNIASIEDNDHKDNVLPLLELFINHYSADKSSFDKQALQDAFNKLVLHINKLEISEDVTHALSIIRTTYGLDDIPLEDLPLIELQILLENLNDRVDWLNITMIRSNSQKSLEDYENIIWFIENNLIYLSPKDHKIVNQAFNRLDELTGTDFSKARKEIYVKQVASGLPGDDPLNQFIHIMNIDILNPRRSTDIEKFQQILIALDPLRRLYPNQDTLDSAYENINLYLYQLEIERIKNLETTVDGKIQLLDALKPRIANEFKEGERKDFVLSILNSTICLEKIKTLRPLFSKLTLVTENILKYLDEKKKYIQNNSPLRFDEIDQIMSRIKVLGTIASYKKELEDSKFTNTKKVIIENRLHVITTNEIEKTINQPNFSVDMPSLVDPYKTYLSNQIKEALKSESESIDKLLTEADENLRILEFILPTEAVDLSTKDLKVYKEKAEAIIAELNDQDKIFTIEEFNEKNILIKDFRIELSKTQYTQYKNVRDLIQRLDELEAKYKNHDYQKQPHNTLIIKEDTKGNAINEALNFHSVHKDIEEYQTNISDKKLAPKELQKINETIRSRINLLAYALNINQTSYEGVRKKFLDIDNLYNQLKTHPSILTASTIAYIDGILTPNLRELGNPDQSISLALWNNFKEIIEDLNSLQPRLEYLNKLKELRKEVNKFHPRFPDVERANGEIDDLVHSIAGNNHPKIDITAKVKSIARNMKAGKRKLKDFRSNLLHYLSPGHPAVQSLAFFIDYYYNNWELANITVNDKKTVEEQFNTLYFYLRHDLRLPNEDFHPALQDILLAFKDFDITADRANEHYHQNVEQYDRNMLTIPLNHQRHIFDELKRVCFNNPNFRAERVNLEAVFNNIDRALSAPLTTRCNPAVQNSLDDLTRKLADIDRKARTDLARLNQFRTEINTLRPSAARSRSLQLLDIYINNYDKDLTGNPNHQVFKQDTLEEFHAQLKLAMRGQEGNLTRLHSDIHIVYKTYNQTNNLLSVYLVDPLVVELKFIFKQLPDGVADKLAAQGSLDTIIAALRSRNIPSSLDYEKIIFYIENYLDDPALRQEDKLRIQEIFEKLDDLTHTNLSQARKIVQLKTLLGSLPNGVKKQETLDALQWFIDHPKLNHQTEKEAQIRYNEFTTNLRYYLSKNKITLNINTNTQLTNLQTYIQTTFFIQNIKPLTPREFKSLGLSEKNPKKEHFDQSRDLNEELPYYKDHIKILLTQTSKAPYSFFDHAEVMQSLKKNKAFVAKTIDKMNKLDADLREQLLSETKANQITKINAKLALLKECLEDLDKIRRNIAQIEANPDIDRKIIYGKLQKTANAAATQLDIKNFTGGAPLPVGTLPGISVPSSNSKAYRMAANEFDCHWIADSISYGVDATGAPININVATEFKDITSRQTRLQFTFQPGIENAILPTQKVKIKGNMGILTEEITVPTDETYQWAFGKLKTLRAAAENTDDPIIIFGGGMNIQYVEALYTICLHKKWNVIFSSDTFYPHDSVTDSKKVTALGEVLKRDLVRPPASRLFESFSDRVTPQTQIKLQQHTSGPKK